jgi:hypothetical protein
LIGFDRRMTTKKVSVNSKETKSDSSEPYFYVGLVLKGTEKQYVNLLKYVNGRNGSRIIYQSKSLTYLRITRDDPAKLKAIIMDPDELAASEVSCP